MKARSRLLVLLYSWFLIAVFVTAFFKSRAMATTDYARQTGQPCAACHTRPEGGGELNAQGLAYVRGGYQWPIPAGVEAYTPSNAAKVLKLIFGYIHLTVTVIWFGTIFYIHIIVKPQKLTTGVPRAEGTLGWISIVLMTLTGIALTVFRYLETGSVFSGTFGTVFIVKLVQFGIMVIVALIATLVLSRRMRRGARPGGTPGSSSGEITPEMLSSFEGKDGSRAVIAVSGRLYDVTDSRLWQNGVHLRRHQAGQDLTEALKEAPHGEEVLERVPMIGELKVAPAKAGPRRSRAQRVFVAFAYVNLTLMFGILLCVAWWKWGFTWTPSSPARDVPTTVVLSEVSSDCITCHRSNEFMTAQIVEGERSVHATWQVGCYECHRAEEGDTDAMEHNGYVVSVLVTPRDCARCHVREAEEFAASRHSRGGDILDSLDNVLGEQVEGLAATVMGCQQCHGAPVEVMPGGTLSPAS